MRPHNPPCRPVPCRQTGAVLPVSLMLLLIISMSTLMSVRRTAATEVTGHNLRVREIAQQQAQAVLRYCERVAIDAIDNAGRLFPGDAARISPASLNGADDVGALWPVRQNWTDGSARRITVPQAHTAEVRVESRGAPAPQCLVEPMNSGEVLITARGLSADATLNNASELQSGSEVWLQSVLSRAIPTR